MGIIDVYGNIVINAKYDEAYGANCTLIDGKYHGVCIDFSRMLIEKLKEMNIECGLISTLNDDGFKHASVVYKTENGVFIADPVTDVKLLNEEKGLSREDAIKVLLTTGNYNVTPNKYIRRYGAITAYDESMNVVLDNILDKEEVEAIPAINQKIEKKFAACQSSNGLNALKELADGPCLLACQTLYKKGIDTFCSNYVPNSFCSINVAFNSLSDENKKIVFELQKNNPDKYFVMLDKGFYGELGHNDEYDENHPFQLVFGLSNIGDMDEATINIEMNKLITMLKKQTFMHGVYTRDEVLSNKHNKMNPLSLISGLTECNSTSDNTNEEIAKNEELFYSPKYNLFFERYINKSRYIESLYREEHDLRSNEEIATSGNVYYDIETGMYFESKEDALIFKGEPVEPVKKPGVFSKLKTFFGKK